MLLPRLTWSFFKATPSQRMEDIVLGWAFSSSYKQQVMYLLGQMVDSDANQTSGVLHSFYRKILWLTGITPMCSHPLVWNLLEMEILQCERFVRKVNVALTCSETSSCLALLSSVLSQGSEQWKWCCSATEGDLPGDTHMLFTTRDLAGFTGTYLALCVVWQGKVKKQKWMFYVCGLLGSLCLKTLAHLS